QAAAHRGCAGLPGNPPRAAHHHPHPPFPRSRHRRGVRAAEARGRPAGRRGGPGHGGRRDVIMRDMSHPWTMPVLQLDAVRGTVRPPPAPANPRDLSWGDTFHQYSITHLVTVSLCVLLIWATVHMGVVHRRKAGLARDVADAPGQMLGAMLTVYWLIYQLWWNFPPRPLARDSWLPLHLCDLAGLVAG